MKKLIVVFAAFLAVMFAAPAFAADNLDISGSFRTRLWDYDSKGFVDDADENYFDQRMRVKAKIKASDQAYVVIRADMGDTQWGNGFDGVIARPGAQADNYRQAIDFDRLYGHYETETWSVRVGQQYLGLGVLEVLDANTTAINFRLKMGAVEPSLIYGKVEENGSVNDDGANDDTNLYAINLSFDIQGWDSNVFYALADDDAADTEAWGLGFYTSGKLGVVALTGELAFLGGDAGANVDYEGVQFYLKGEGNLNDAFKVGAEFLYAQGADAGEDQLTNLADFGDFTVVDTNAPCATDVTIVADGPFDYTGDNAGVVAGTLFASYQATEQFSFGGKFSYLTPEEDENTNIDSTVSFSAWANYDLGSNTSFMVLYNLSSHDYDVDPANEDDQGIFYARFLINF